MSLLRSLILLMFACLALPAQAQTFPPFNGLVVDNANILPPEVEASLVAELTALQHSTGRQLVVATIADLQGYPIEDYGYRLGRGWGVGLRDINNGAILIVAPNDRKVRIEVGYGLEPRLTDALSSTIIAGRIVPAFRAGDIPGGVVAGTDALIEQLSLPDAEAQARVQQALAAQKKAKEGGFPVSLIFWGIVLAVILISMMRNRAGGRRYRGGSGPVVIWGPGWSGGGSGWSSGGDSSPSSGGGWMDGGFSGGGGGSFGGGGASGSW